LYNYKFQKKGESGRERMEKTKTEEDRKEESKTPSN